MGAPLGALGVGLSVLFGLFLVVLAVEVYFMLVASHRRSVGGSSLAVRTEPSPTAAEGAGSYVREAALVGSFGGYDATPMAGFAAKFLWAAREIVPSPPPPPVAHLLFTIAEETKEEMHQHLVAGESRTYSSSSFATPPTSCPSSLFGSPVTAASHFSSPASSFMASHTPSPTSAVSRFSAASSPGGAAIVMQLPVGSVSSSPSLSRQHSASERDYPVTQKLRGSLGALFYRPSPARSAVLPSVLAASPEVSRSAQS